MPHFGDGRATSDSVSDATRTALETADDLDCESLVMPILGTGAAGFDFEPGARIVCEEVATYRPDTLADVRVIAYSEREARIVSELADRRQST